MTQTGGSRVTAVPQCQNAAADSAGTERRDPRTDTPEFSESNERWFLSQAKCLEMNHKLRDQNYFQGNHKII